MLMEMTPLADASARGNMEIVELLVESRAEVNATSPVRGGWEEEGGEGRGGEGRRGEARRGWEGEQRGGEGRGGKGRGGEGK